jgi:hypothetical protein
MCAEEEEEDDGDGKGDRKWNDNVLASFEHWLGLV